MSKIFSRLTKKTKKLRKPMQINGSAPDPFNHFPNTLSLSQKSRETKRVKNAGTDKVNLEDREIKDSPLKNRTISVNLLTRETTTKGRRYYGLARAARVYTLGLAELMTCSDQSGRDADWSNAGLREDVGQFWQTGSWKIRKLM